jgi:translocation and assembly module TamB
MKGNWVLKNVLVKILKITGWVVASVVLLLVALTFIIQIPSVQNKIVQKAISFLQNKIHTEVRLEHISLSFPKKVVLSGIYLEDQHQDTLLHARELAIDTDLWGLLDSQIDLNEVQLQDLTANVNRSSDGVFNFDYIIRAFAGDTTVKDTTSATWKFAVYNVQLSRSTISFLDSLDGNFIDVKIGNLGVDMNEFDLDKSIYHADEINLTDCKATVLQTKRASSNAAHANPATSSVSTASPPDLRFNEINLKKIIVSYTQQGEGQVVQLNLGEINVSADQIDLHKQIVELSEVTIASSFLSYQQMDNDVTKKAEQQSDTTTASSWKIKLDDIDVADLAVQYYDFRTPVSESGIDFNHLWISKFDLQANDLTVDGSTMGVQLQNLAMREKSGFAITSAEADVSITPNSITVSDLQVITPHSSIALKAKANFTSLDAIVKDYAHAYLRFSIKDTHLSLADVLYFQPHLLDRLPLVLKKNTAMDIDAALNGKVDDLNISELRLLLFDSTSLVANGTIKGLPDLDNTWLNVHLDKFHTTKKEADALLPDSLLPSSIQLPRWITLSGDFKGTMKTPDVQAVLNSSAGRVAVDAKMNLNSSVKENYTGKLNIQNFQLGYVLGDSAIGRLDMNASVKGTGLKLNELDAVVDVMVNHIEYNKYDYRDVKLNGSVKNYFFSGAASMEDKNLDIHLKGDLNYTDSIPDYKLTVELKQADLEALHLSARPLKARGTIDVDLATADFKTVNGDIAIRKFGVFNGKSLYMVDSLLVASIDQKGESQLYIRSDILTGDFKGTINLFSLPEVVSRHFNRYFSLNDTAYTKQVAPQDFKFSLVLNDTDLLTEVLLPDLDPFIPGEIAGEFNSEKHKLDLRFGISKVKYGSLSVDSVNFKVTSDEDELKYSFSLRNLAADTLRIAGLLLSGKVADDSLRTRFTVLDSVREEKYVLGGVINSTKEAFRFRLLKDEVVLNYKEWITPEGNYLLIKKTGLLPHQFEIKREQQRIAFMKKNGTDSALSLVFQHLDLKDMTSLVQGITPITGIAEGDLTVLAGDKGAFSSKLKINELAVMNQTWGNLVLALNKKASSPYMVDLGITGDMMDLRVKGSYDAQLQKPEVNITAELSRLNLEAIQPLTLGIMKRMEGLLTGKINVDGTLSDPEIDGSFTFKNASFVPAAVNSTFKLSDETIKLTAQGVEFNKLKILDEKNNTASIDGKITTQDLATYALDLDVRADNFQLLNSTIDDNELFYGKVSVTTRMKIGGTSALPRITMEKVSLGDKSVFNFVVPTSEKGIQEQKGIVTFVDKDAEKDPFLASIEVETTHASNSFRGMNLRANIDLTDGETFNIIIDPATGDKLSVKGNAALSFAMNASGDMTLSGRYEITSGSYDFSFYKLIKRNFLIEKGSTITWYGDPMEAQMDIKALFKVETSPLELVSNQIDMSNQQLMNTYKQRIPFLVYLMIQGELLAPQISFKLDMPMDKQNLFGGNVYATIQDINTRESDLNKQVFALLVLKRFIAENPFDSQGGGDLGSSARTSVSQILTEQLNRLSQNIKGVQLSFDVKSYEDYSTGTAQGQTQFQLGLSKTLFNDRLVVKISGNLDIEGQDASPQHSAADYIGDLALEYKITPDGRFRITGFRNGNYDMIDGELTETGAGLIYIKDYNAFRELFKANETENP